MENFRIIYSRLSIAKIETKKYPDLIASHGSTLLYAVIVEDYFNSSE
jgi:hypothetical protein